MSLLIAIFYIAVFNQNTTTTLYNPPARPPVQKLSIDLQNSSESSFKISVFGTNIF